MKQTIILLTFIAIAIAYPLYALDIPPLKGHVNDYAGMLSPSTVTAIETKLADFEKAESTQVAVLTIPSLEGEVLEEYCMKVAEKWKIGQKGRDNGVILLIARQERKMRIEVGYGLEGKLTDLLAGRIIDRIITPRFKAGDFDNGTSLGVAAILQAVRGEYDGTVETPEQATAERSSWLMPIAVIATILGLAAAMFVIILRLFGGSGSGAASSGRTYASGGASSRTRSSGGSSSGSYGGGSYSGSGGGFGGGGASGGW